jgi:hypothetical protein
MTLQLHQPPETWRQAEAGELPLLHPILERSCSCEIELPRAASAWPGFFLLRSRLCALLKQQSENIRGCLEEIPTQQAGGQKISLFAAPANNHSNWPGGTCVAPDLPNKQYRSTLPVDPLHVLVNTYRQAMATSESPALQYFATIGSSHAGTKPMDTQTTANFWLISSFRHMVSTNL